MRPKHRILEVLVEVWNPRGHKSGGVAEEEYRAYADKIAELLRRGGGKSKIAAQLLRAEQYMDLSDSPALAANRQKAVDDILAATTKRT
jgi:hypothetical protein